DRVRDTLRPKLCRIYTENGRTTMTEAWLRHEWVRAGGASIQFCSIFDHDHPQRLHAKGCAIVRGDRVRLVFGSANFTRAGLFSTAADGNVEAVLVANELTLKSCDPERLFDPCKTARSEPLRTSPRPKEPSQPPTQVRLVEAALDEDHL